jgi:hypothetical protein
MAVYLLPIDWRRAKFFVGHPTVQPDMPDTAAIITDDPSYFLPIEQISNVIRIRDWLYSAALLGRYRLFGCYEQITSIFKGIMLIFDCVSDRLRFDQYCQSGAPV